MDDLAALTHQIEYQFLKTIIHGLRSGAINAQQAKEFAVDFLAIEPFTSEDDASAKIAQFAEKHKEFVNLKEYMDSYDKERETTGKVNKMRKLIKENNIDEALAVAKE